MKLDFVKDFGNSIINVPKIYEMKNNSWGRAILHYLVIMVFFCFPLMIAMMTMKTFLFDSFGIDIINEEKMSEVLADEELMEARKNDQFEVIEYLPKSCYFNAGKLVCHGNYDLNFTRTQRVNDELETERVRLVINPSEDFVLEDKDGIIILFHEYSYDIYLKGVKFSSYYSSSLNLRFSEFNLSDYTDALAIKEILNFTLTGIVHNVSWVINLCLFLVFALIDFLYILLLAFCARFLKYRDNNFPEFSEIVKMLMYASTIPCLVCFVLGFFGAYAIGTVLFNFILPLIIFMVYIKNKSIIKGQMSTKSAKEAEYVL